MKKEAGFKGFKKVHEDDRVATLRHESGHEIKIAKHVLNSKMKKELAALPMHDQPKKMADGGEVQSSTADDSPEQIANDAAAQGPTPSDAEVSPQDQSKPLEIEPVTEQPQQQAPEVQPQAQPDQQASAPSDMQGIGQQRLGALEKQEAGQMLAAKAQGAVGAEESGALKNYQNQSAQDLSDFNTKNNRLVTERQNLQNDINNGHIDPQRYIHNMSTGGKIANAIGLILGGIGSGLTGTPNLAYQYLQGQIEKDVEAQKTDLGKKENLLSHNLRETGDLRSAYDLTRMQHNDVLAAQLKAAAAKAQNQVVQGNLLNIAGQFESQSAQIQRDNLINQMRMGGGQAGDPAAMVPLLVPEPHQKQAFSEIEAAENTRKMSGAIMKSFEDATNENTVLRTGAGYLRTPGSVMALHQAMQPTFKDLEGTVRQAAMDNTFHNITPAPGDSDHTIAIKRQALQDYLQSKLSAPTARAFGIDLSKFQRTQPNLGGGGQEIRRMTTDGKIAIYDQNKNFVRYE